VPRYQTLFGNAISRNSVSHPLAKKVSVLSEPKQSFGEVRSQTEFGNEAGRRFRLVCAKEYRDSAATHRKGGCTVVEMKPCHLGLRTFG
jgi:hypothetical protein